jgi:hypothetical protein
MTWGPEVEVPLAGGDVTEGVVRVGDTVRRPVGPHSDLVHRVLRHLEDMGFDGAPRFLGLDASGREVLSFMEGEVAGRPWPAWVTDEDRITSVARLVRRYDDAVASLGIPAEAGARPEPPGAPPTLADPELIGHQDVTPENVVFRDGIAVALLDFDLVGPAARVDELSNVAQWWAPLLAPSDRPAVLADVDPARRCRLLADAYGLGRPDRERFVAVARARSERSWHLMRHTATTVGGGWQRMWDEGWGDVIHRRIAWLETDGDRIRDALLR